MLLSSVSGWIRAWSAKRRRWAARASVQDATLTGSLVSPRDSACVQRAVALVSGPFSQLVSRSRPSAVCWTVSWSTSTQGERSGLVWLLVMSMHSVRESAVVGDRERVVGLVPAGGRPAFDEPVVGLAAVALAGLFGPLAGPLVLDVADRQPQQLDHRLVVGEVPAVLDDLAELVVQALDRVRRVDDLADFRRERQERGEPFPGAFPGRHHARVAVPELGVGQRE